MLNTLSKILLIFLLILIISCAGSSTGEKPGDFSYISNIGPVSAYDYEEKTRLSLNKYQYQIERTDDFGDRKYMETMWKFRAPFEDEAALSVVQVRTRLVLNVTPRTRVPNDTQLFRVQFLGEIMVQFAGITEWQQIQLTPMRQKYFRDWARELKNEYSSGMRRY